MPWRTIIFQMKYQYSILNILKRLRDGESVNAGEIRSAALKKIINSLLESGDISFSRKGRSRGYYTAPSKERFTEACATLDPSLVDLDLVIRFQEGEIASRAEKVEAFGDSKFGGADRVVKGFNIVSDRRLTVSYLGDYFSIGPKTGLHVIDWRGITPPADATIVVVENSECFYDLRWIHNSGLEYDEGPYIIMSRFPSCEGAKLFLESIPNKLLYFGDFDLAGVGIYEAEFKRRLGNRIKFIVPSDLEERIVRNGNPSLYTKQLNSNFGVVTSPSNELTTLLDLLHRFQSCYEQEGYCLPLKH